MLIILEHELGEIVVETDNDNADEVSDISISFVDDSNDDDEGNNFLLSSIKDVLVQELSEQYGIYGHLVTPGSITNLDLVAAVKNLKSFKVIGDLPELDFEPLPDDVES